MFVFDYNVVEIYSFSIICVEFMVVIIGLVVGVCDFR